MPHKLPSSDATPDPDSPAPVVRRISNPRLKKPSNKPVPAPAATADVPPLPEPAAPDQPPAEPAASPAPADSDSSPVALPATAPASSSAASPPLSAQAEPDRDAPPADGDDWPEPDAPATPGQENKRKRRRRKGKGQGQSGNFQAGGSPAVEETHSIVEPAAAADAARPHRPPPNPLGNAPRQPAHRPKLDPETLATKAWKIYLAEVSEEGVALIGDQDARELARRCFRLAEIFIEEQARRNQAL